MQQKQGLARGLWGVLATPFRDGASAVDEASLCRLVHDQVAAGATGLVALGVFGEGARLDAGEQLQVVRTVEREVGALPLVIGLAERETAAAVATAVRLTEALRDGAVSFMVQVPTNDSARLVQHLSAVHEATGAGVVVQDYPVASGVHIGSGDLLASIAQCPFVVAVKSEAPPTSVAIADLTAGCSVPVFGGLGGLGLLDELMVGAAGAMTGFSHPQGLSATLHAWESGGYEAARAAYLPWLPLVNFEAQASVGLAVRKTALRERGIISGAGVRPPAPAMPTALLPLLQSHLESVRGRVAA